MRTAIRFCGFLIFLSICLPIRAALTANDLLLVVNKNQPKGQELAEYYAQQRHVPDGRVVALDLPITDDVSFNDYETKIVAPLREAIEARHLRNDVKCIVTFYGVPLRVAQRINTRQDEDELRILHDDLAIAQGTAQPLVEKAEEMAKSADPSFAAQPDGTIGPAEAYPRRAEFAVKFLIDHLNKMPDGSEKDSLQRQVGLLTKEFREPVQVDEPAIDAATQPVGAPSTVPAMNTPEMAEKLRDLSSRRWDPAARRELRQIMSQAGALGYLNILEAQIEYFTTEDTQSAVDNELALLWWNYYPRIHWQPNPLNYRYANGHGSPTLMVMRLDAAKPEQVHAMIDTSLKVEASGLKGMVVIDSRGIAPLKPNGQPDPYGEYDQTIRNLAMLLKAKTKLQLLVDDKPTLLPVNSAKDVAVYCGWYSPNHFVQCITSAPGGVAAHIASFEMQTLHNPTWGWCQHLIDHGAVATFGPVSEPYLVAFPAADEFFPLLFTGKLTLAEVYWRTTPLTSWRMAMVGDPLYTPYKVNPPLKVEDLPERLQKVFGDADGGVGLPQTAPTQ
jgi:uncharacterized protein (TIGR03790 family)